jgi:hypothetical protein
VVVLQPPHHSVGKCQDDDGFQVSGEPIKPLSQEPTQSCKEKLRQGKCRFDDLRPDEETGELCMAMRQHPQAILKRKASCPPRRSMFGAAWVRRHVD